MLDAISDPVVVVDGALHVLAANQAARRASSGAAPERCHALCRPAGDGPPPACPLRGERLPRRAGVREIRGLFGDRRSIHLVSTFPLAWEEPRPAFVQIYRDVTTERQLLSQVTRNQQLSTVGRLAAEVAHEIRNPLSAMTNAVSLLRDAQGLGEEELALVDMVLEESRRLNRIVGDFLGFARSSDPLESLPLEEVVTSTVDSLRRDPRNRDDVGIQVHVPEQLPPMPMVGDRVRQVVWNLLLNALQALDGPGRIDVALARRTYEGRPGVDVRIRDSGCGMPQEVRERAFEPFATTKPNGSGLGLAVARQIVEAHGGAIGLAPAREGGTQAWFWLPEERRGG